MLKYFDEAYYLMRYKDVATAVSAGKITAEQHYLLAGEKEGRQPSIYFDPAYYKTKYPDLATGLKTGGLLEHFIQNGERELRSPSAFFNTQYYLSNYSDIAAAVYRGETTPLTHFIQSGSGELRTTNPFFNPVAYLAANADVAKAGVSPYLHFAYNGIAENRSWGNGLSWTDFQNDPVFKAALFTGRFDTAFARIATVAPFLESFVKPAGYVYESTITVPVDFVAYGTTKLVLPDGFTLPQGIKLTSAFTEYYAPKLLTVSPADNATGITPSASFVFTFDQKIKQGTGTIIFTDTAKTAVVTVDVTDSSKVTFSDKVMTIKPRTLLEGLHYSVTMDGKTVVNMASVASAGIKSSTEYDFTLAPLAVALVEGDTTAATLAGEIFSISAVPQTAASVTGFTAGTDKISLTKSAFTKITSSAGSAVQKTELLISTAAVDPAASTDSRTLIFDSTTGVLYYNDNGATAGGLHEVVTLSGVTSLSASDILVA